MCEPVSIMTAIGAVLSTAYSKIQADKADRENKKKFLAAAELTNEQAGQQYFNLSLKQASERSAAAQEIQNISQDAQEARGTAAAIAASSGVSGASVDALLQEFARDEGDAIAMTLRNQHLAETAAQQEKFQVHTRAEASILGAQPALATQPNLGAALGTIGVAAARGAALSGEDPGDPAPTTTTGSGGPIFSE